MLLPPRLRRRQRQTDDWRMTGETRESSAGADGRVFIAVNAMAVLTFIIVLDQFLLRFIVPVDFLATVRQQETPAHDFAVFRAHGLWFFMLVAATALATLTAAPALTTTSRDAMSGELPTPAPIFLVACTLNAVLTVVVSLLLGSGTNGGAGPRYFAFSIAGIWLLCIALACRAIHRRGRVQLHHWLLHNSGLALLPLTVHAQLPVWLLAGFSLYQSTLAALIFAVSLHLAVTFALASRTQHMS